MRTYLRGLMRIESGLKVDWFLAKSICKWIGLDHHLFRDDPSIRILQSGKR